jgi:hypothetical protein
VSPKQILAIAVLVIGVGVRLAMSMSGDDVPAPPADPAGTAAAAPGSDGSATQPVSQPGAATPAPAAPKKKHVRQSANFPRRFQKRVVRVCGRYERVVKTAIADRDEKSTERLRRVIRATEDMATDLEDLKPPARNEEAWGRYTKFYRDASDLFGRIESEIADGDKPAFDRYVAKSRTLGGREDRLNRRYGFSACVND